MAAMDMFQSLPATVKCPFSPARGMWASRSKPFAFTHSEPARGGA